MSVIVYYSSVSGSLELKSQQSKIIHYLDAKKIQYQLVDITQSTDTKDEMRRKIGNPTALPPQIFNGDTYCGDYDMFDDAVEAGSVDAFLKL